MEFLKRRGVADVVVFVLVILGLIALQPSVENSDLIILPFAALVFLRLLYLMYKGEVLFKRDLYCFKNASRAVPLYVGITAAAVLVLWLLQGYLTFPAWLKDDEVVIFLFVHAFVQEVMYRVYLVNRLKLFIENPLYIALASGAVFGLSHLILPDAWVVFSLTFVAGTVWSYLYLKYPNLLYVWGSHAIINFAINSFYL